MGSLVSEIKEVMDTVPILRVSSSMRSSSYTVSMDVSEGGSAHLVDSRDGGVEKGSKSPYSITLNARFFESLDTEQHLQGERMTFDGLLSVESQVDGNG